MDYAYAYPAVVILALVFIFLSWKVPIVWVRRFHVGNSDKRAELEDSYRKTVVQILGAAAIALTFVWTWSKDRQTLDLDHVKTFNEQFSSAAKLIDDKHVATRVAGIYWMGKISSIDQTYLTPFKTIIVAKIREKIANSNAGSPLWAIGASPPPVTDDINAGIKFLGTLPPSNIDLEGLYLVGGLFNETMGNHGFQKAKFYSAYLYKANFADVDLTGAIFDGANMADVQAVGSDLWSDKFIAEWWESKSWQRVQYVVKFNRAVLVNASFHGTSVAGAIFEGADLAGAKFIGADLSRADFRGAKNLEKATFDEICYGAPGPPPVADGKPAGLSDAVMQKLKPCQL
jgi:uncharacterized protein YjbI with pentapeptide repeats